LLNQSAIPLEPKRSSHLDAVPYITLWADGSWLTKAISRSVFEWY